MDEFDSPLRPVRAIGKEYFKSQGAILPFFTNGSLAHPLQSWQNALIIVHGRKRNADDYFEIAQTIIKDAKTPTLIIAPQFLTKIDIKAHGLGRDFFHWDALGWMGGDQAIGPHTVSGFTILDDLINHLSDRSMFPDLRRIVMAGHSGGGQVVHRYAILSGLATDINFIVANPSSYVYFSEDRLNEKGFFIPSEASYPGYNRWKYGLENRPAYGQDCDDKPLERRYIGRNVTYLLGARDCDPAHPALDRTMPAMAQGVHRLGRGRAYWRYLQARHGSALRHQYFEIPEVGHDPLGMFAADVARTSLFGQKSNKEAGGT